jgi:CrcB protein
MSGLFDCLAVGLGGALGSILRYLLGLVPLKQSDGLPVTTLAINVVGAFCIGLIAAAAAKRSDFDPRLLLFLKVGICGGFTTFSTFSYETGRLLQQGKTGVGILYVVLSVGLGLAAVLAAQQLVK